MTYPYEIIGSNTSIIKDIISGEHSITEKIKKSKKPIVIIGESALNGSSGKYIFETIKLFLKQNDFIRKDWNALNFLNQHASRVGAIDLGIYSITENENFEFFNKLENDKFKFIYLLGVDTINFEKKDKFIVYQGSHGDKGAEIADIILPGAAYTEKNGLFINLEGKIQECFKASYPPGEAREDWEILNNISMMMNKKYSNHDNESLRNSIKKIINSKTDIKFVETYKVNFIEENILIKSIDYYYTNAIARSSKIMSECRQIKKKFLLTGIEKAS